MGQDVGEIFDDVIFKNREGQIKLVPESCSKTQKLCVIFFGSKISKMHLTCSSEVEVLVKDFTKRGWTGSVLKKDFKPMAMRLICP